MTILEKLANKERKSNAGAKSYLLIWMFKILILQRYYNLSDKQIEYQILDRLSVCRFLGLSLEDKVPDEKTVWDFREQLINQNLDIELFNIFKFKLEENDLLAHEGKIIDASFVEMPKKRNTRQENKHIKETGTAPKSWYDKPHKKWQKDVDARWTKQNQENHYGYKNHIKIDNKHKSIDKQTVTDASVHDSQVLENLLDEKKDKHCNLWADSAYSGENQDNTIEKYKIKNKVNEKGKRNNPLTEKQKASNREKSKIRARVEHVFGFIEGSMNRLQLNCIGIKRATAQVSLINLMYNMFRYEQLVRLHGITMANFQKP